VGDNVYERRDLEVGLSDGLMTEVLSGIEAADAVKIWNQPRYE
jgi:HlyD family secretion protein